MSALQTEDDSLPERARIVILRLEGSLGGVANLHSQGGQRTDASGRKHQLLTGNQRIDQRALADAGIAEETNGQFLTCASRVGVDTGQRSVQIGNAIGQMNEKKRPNGVGVPRVKVGSAGGWHQ